MPPAANLNPSLLYTLTNAAEAMKAAKAPTPHSANGLRLWCDQGRITHVRLSDGERVIPGHALIGLMQKDVGDSA